MTDDDGVAGMNSIVMRAPVIIGQSASYVEQLQLRCYSTTPIFNLVKTRGNGRIQVLIRPDPESGTCKLQQKAVW